MALFYANTAAEARGQAPPRTPHDDGVLTVENAAYPLPHVAPVPQAGGFDPFPAPGLPDRPSVIPVAWTLRPFDVWAARNLDGHHGEVTRVQGTPVGALTPTGGATRAVFRPLPQPWDQGFYQGG